MNDVVPFSNRPRRGVAEAVTSSMTGALPPHISIRGNRFTMVDAAGQRIPVGDTLYACIIDANPHPSRLYWGDKPYEDGNDQPPVCFSDNGLAASNRAQAPQATTCAACPHAGWGSSQSKLTGKGVPACREYKKLGILVVSPQGHIEEMPFMLGIPPASLKAVHAYCSKIAAQPAPGTDRKLDTYDVVTRITFVDGQFGLLEFAQVAYLDKVQGLAARVDAVWDSGVTDAMVGKQDRPWAGAQAALAAPEKLPELPRQDAQPRPQPAPQPKPQAASEGVQQQAAPAFGQGQAEKPKSGRGGARPGAGRPAKTNPAPQADMFTQQSATSSNKAQQSNGEPQFGMQQGAAPDDELDAAIENAFGLET